MSVLRNSDCNGGDKWLEKLIRTWNEGSTQDLAKAVVDKAVKHRKADREDDVTAVARSWVLPSFHVRISFSSHLSSPVITPSDTITIISPVVRFTVSVENFIPFRIPAGSDGISRTVTLPFFFQMLLVRLLF